MSWTYDATLLKDPEVGPLMQVRLLIGDTDEDYAYMQDEEIQFKLDSGDSIVSVAIWCVKRIIAKLAKEVTYKIGPEQVNASDRLAHFQEVLAELSNSREEDIAAAPSAVIRPPCFQIGMTDSYVDWGTSPLWTHK